MKFEFNFSKLSDYGEVDSKIKKDKNYDEPN